MPTDYDDHNHSTTAIDTDIAKLKLDLAAQDARIRALEGATPPPPPPPPPPPVGTVYGPAVNCDSKSNLQVGWTNRAKLSHRYRATSSSTPVNVRFAQRGGSGYSGGNGGTMRVTIQGDANGLPNGTVYGTATYGPKVPSGGIFDAVPVTGGKPLTKGTLYHVVYENTDASPTTNYISLNHLFVFTAVTPRQAKYPDTDMAVLYDGGSGYRLQTKYTPCFDLTYSDGSHDGQGYIGMISLTSSVPVAFSNVSGSSKVRERFTPAQDVSFTEAWVRVRRTGGNSALNLILDGAGTPIVLGSVAASGVPITASGGDNGGSVWVHVAWVGAMTLRAGTEYSLRLDCPSDTTYTTAPIRAGTDSGFAPSLSFTEGVFEMTSNGTTWAQIYPSSPMDMQAYLR